MVQLMVFQYNHFNLLFRNLISFINFSKILLKSYRNTLDMVYLIHNLLIFLNLDKDKTFNLIICGIFMLIFYLLKIMLIISIHLYLF